MLARAPGRLGEYLGLTAGRMGPGDAVHAGFADSFVRRADWPALIAALAADADTAIIARVAQPAPASALKAAAAQIDAAMAGPDATTARAALLTLGTEWAQKAAEAITHNSPLSMAVTLTLLRALPLDADIEMALSNEYRFTWRAADPARTDFIEGVRAQLIDKDRRPVWRHGPSNGVPAAEVAELLAPLGHAELVFAD